MDIRIYLYTNGTLVRPKNRFLKHKYNSVEKARDRITTYTDLRHRQAINYNLTTPSTQQYVIVQYTASYESHIIEIITL